MDKLTIWEVIEMDGNGGSDKVIALFDNPAAAQKLKNTNSWLHTRQAQYFKFVVHGPERVHTLLLKSIDALTISDTILIHGMSSVFHSHQHYQEVQEKSLIKSALAKLSPKEREALSKHKF